MPKFTIIGRIANCQTIAVGKKIRELPRLQREHGNGKWRKCKGEGTVQLPNGKILRVEVHWYEAQGIGRKEEKIKW